LTAPRVLRAALGGYKHLDPIRSGAIGADEFRLEFEQVAPISRAFAPMVRELRYDVSEIAIATFLQAKAFGRPLMLLPVVMAGRFQESALLCRVDSDIRSPADLAGRRIGVRAYSQTTGMWLRGSIAEEFGVKPDAMRWITFEGAHVPEYRDPPWAERAPAGRDLLGMLREGEVDAVIAGLDTPDDPGLRTVFPDPERAADAFWNRHHFVPINHLVCIRAEHAAHAPELTRMFGAARTPVAGRDPRPFGRDALDPAIALAIRYCTEQGLLPRALTLDEVWSS
jgi:4,5-dihydroxyphthalate decarboxylase